MNNQGATGIATAIILISVILIAATAASVILSNPEEIPNEADFEEMLDEVVDEISTYLQVKDMMGKYYPIGETLRIQKIAILIKPLFSIDLDISELMIKLHNGEQVRILYYGEQAEFISSYSLFEHPLWNNIDNNEFGFIVTLDKDRSLVDYDNINENTDLAYIAIKLTEDFAMKKGDTMTITLFPSTGISRTLTFTAPLPIKRVVYLD